MNLDIKIIKEAYRKLKGSVYYDKTLACVRTRIAEYETRDVDAKLKAFYEALKDKKKWTKVEASILESIRVLTFPKGVKNIGEEFPTETPMVISNLHSNKAIIESYNNFIDMNLEGYLVGTLWVLLVGHDIDKTLDGRLKNTYCYGNRLQDTIFLPDGELTESPNLFKPYFDQYERWRNCGIDEAKNAIDSGKNVIITMLDLTRYYYNVDLSLDRYNLLTNNEFLDNVVKDVAKRINRTVYKIVKKYSEICKLGHVFLPIGFHPSSILANAYLYDLDKKISKQRGTIYYGRYVDDIMWIKTTDDQKLVDSIHKNGSHVVADYVIDELERKKIIRRTKESYALSGEEDLTVQKKKFRFFFLDCNGSKDLLREIEKDIQSNTSEFNFIPEEYASDFNSKLFHLDRDDTINKIRGIRGASIDKYTLSKIIGKSVMMSPFTKDEQVKEFVNGLMQILDSKEIINNFLLWESILNYFVASSRLKDIVTFSAHIVEALGFMDENRHKTEKYAYLNGSAQIVSVKDSLLQFYYSCLGRSLSVLWGSEVQAAISEIMGILNTASDIICYQSGKMNNLRKRYIKSRMNNKSLLPVTMQSILRIADLDDKGNLVNISNLNQLLEQQVAKKSVKRYRYLPYICSPYEIGFSYLVEQIASGQDDLGNPVAYIDFLKREYAANFSDENWDPLDNFINAADNFICVGTRKEKTISIAVANVKMDEADIYDILDKKPLNRDLRAKEIAELVNIAIKNRARVIVMPEAYVPLQYIKLLAKKSADRQVLINCGVEHVVAKGQVWNLTCVLIPFEVKKGVRYCVPFFRQKNRFAPDEEKEIIGKHLSIPVSYYSPLFRWNNFKFATYCCYELTDIQGRAEHRSKAEVVFGLEWNKDIDYFSNIMESLSRDMYCYCVQSNMSDYGDSRIIAPAHDYHKDIMRVKGGDNATILIGTIDLQKLREAKKSAEKRNEYHFTEIPAGL